MGDRSILDPLGGLTSLVAREIGTAYPTVQAVAANLAAIIAVSQNLANITEVASSASNITTLADQVTVNSALASSSAAAATSAANTVTTLANSVATEAAAVATESATAAASSATAVAACDQVNLYLTTIGQLAATASTANSQVMASMANIVAIASNFSPLPNTTAIPYLTSNEDFGSVFLTAPFTVEKTSAISLDFARDVSGGTINLGGLS